MSERLRFNAAKPIRMWIDGKCFDIKHYKSKYKRTITAKNKREHNVEETQPQITSGEKLSGSKEMPEETETKASQFEILKNDQGKLFTSFQLPTLYYLKLDGFYKNDIETLSKDTSTLISYPKRGADGNLIVTGESEDCIMEVVQQLHSFIGDIRDRNMALQFVSIPCLSEEIKQNFEKFRDDILKDDIDGVHESIFQSPLKLHLTVVVFTLLDDREKSEAISALKEYKTTVLDALFEKTGPIKIHVSGLGYMNNNLKRVDVLYANARLSDETEEHNLQKVVNSIANYFYEKGLVTRYQENVKLHVTLMNTKYRKVPDSPKKRWNKRQSFDATKIMEKYKEYDFGKCDLDSFHLSIMSSKGEDGFYKPLSIIKMNKSC